MAWAVGDDYFISWQGDLRANRAGDGARRRAAELRENRTVAHALLYAFLGRRDDGWSWAKGAAGEEAVARTLSGLPPTHWRVLHDLPIGDRGANVDHLVLGPPGVFSLNTKHLNGRVDVRREEVRRDRRATGYIEAATREAERVRNVLEAQTGEGVRVEPLLVIYGADVRVRSQPRNVTVLPAGRLVRWLRSLPPVMSFEQWQRCCRAATRPGTWTWTAREPTRGERLDTPAGPVSVNRWRRYGHDRLYVKSLAGEQLGWADLKTAEMHVGSPADADAVRAAMRWLRT